MIWLQVVLIMSGVFIGAALVCGAFTALVYKIIMDEEKDDAKW